MKTNHALCRLISALLLLAAGTAQTHAGLLRPAGLGDALYVGYVGDRTIEKVTPSGVVLGFASTGLSAPQGLEPVMHFDGRGN